MIRTLVFLAGWLTLAQPLTPPAAALPPDTEIFLATLSSEAGNAVGAPVNITHSQGYDN